MGAIRIASLLLLAGTFAKLMRCIQTATVLPYHAFMLMLHSFTGFVWSQATRGAEAAGTTVFTLRNNCTHTIWPATLSGNSAAAVGGGGFEMSPNATVSFPAPAGWSGRLWARTGCVAPSPPSSSSGLSCATGDCSGAASCTLGGAPPVTLAEFTLGGADGKDFYDVSLVDGYNVGIGVSATGARVNYSTCGYAGCVGDVNALCPPELAQMASGAKAAAGGDGAAPAPTATTTVACRSACEAFGTPEYCCTGAHGGPSTCGPTKYSRLFKAACPAAYSYAYDDTTSTFTCGAGAQYLITFCPGGHQ
ncbi:Pathogenesis-related protein 5 [Dichanthelium oligosanthes]|uniref:Pathogenesis-related protein 5 n=1 Tax=Dichanthelium oligosanthes TaxID=888268 RepID=A0A1E5WGN5_9POAL|nr:Pathogenesis-related protein 5 [Dichanthelium oligosanthes]